MTEAHQAATVLANQIIASQRAEIEQHKAQRLLDLEQRAQEMHSVDNKASVQEEARNNLKLEAVQTKMEIHKLRRNLQEMMQQFKAVLATASSSQDNKRTSAASADNNSPSEKRRDVRNTPGKKLFIDEMDLRDLQLYLSARLLTDTPSSPMK